MSYASIVPLIGGETIAMENVFKEKPKYFLTFDGFQDNESHLNNYYNHEVPYLNLSEGASYTEKVDVINTVCPCAGLSSLSPSASSTNPMNEWMYKSAEYVLGEVQPKVFWGENAPRLASKMGEPVVKRLRKIGEEHGYTFSIFKTKSILPKAHVPSEGFSPSDTSGLQVGMEVEHERFGFGKVVHMEGTKPDLKATIFFKELGQKQLLLKFAKLRIIG